MRQGALVAFGKSGTNQILVVRRSLELLARAGAVSDPSRRTLDPRERRLIIVRMKIVESVVVALLVLAGAAGVLYWALHNPPIEVRAQSTAKKIIWVRDL